MLAVARDAAEMAARWLQQQGSSNMQADNRLSLLREEAHRHFSKGVEILAKETPYTDVVCLPKKKKWLTNNPTAVALIQTAETHWHPVPDTAYAMYMRYHKNERHPKVIQAYQTQAKVLAELVIGELGNLVTESLYPRSRTTLTQRLR